MTSCSWGGSSPGRGDSSRSGPCVTSPIRRRCCACTETAPIGLVWSVLHTARQLATAIDGFLADPPPVRSTTIPPDTPFAEALLDAYDRAVCAADRVPAADGPEPERLG